MENHNYTIQNLEEYIRQSEPARHERGEAWRVAIGLQQVDGLTPSDYLVDTAKQHIDGVITIGEAKALIDSYYQSASSRQEGEMLRLVSITKVQKYRSKCKFCTLSPFKVQVMHFGRGGSS